MSHKEAYQALQEWVATQKTSWGIDPPYEAQKAFVDGWRAGFVASHNMKPIPHVFPTSINCPGLDIGLKDKNGDVVHTGDTLEFDADEWGDDQTNKFVVRFEEGELMIGGSPSTVDEFCKIIKKWDESQPVFKEDKLEQMMKNAEPIAQSHDVLYEVDEDLKEEYPVHIARFNRVGSRFDGKMVRCWRSPEAEYNMRFVAEDTLWSFHEDFFDFTGEVIIRPEWDEK